MPTANTPMDFASIGALFNDATNRLEGGVTVGNEHKILSDLNAVQTKLSALIKAQPDLFTGMTAIHAQEIVDQIHLETGAIRALGTDPFAAKEINDIHRDLIDIVHGDNNLATLATQHGANGFAAVPAPLAPPAPFHDSAAQTTFLQNFAADAQALGEKAIAAVGTPAAAQVAHDIQVFAANANAFVAAPEQAGLYSARFANELGTHGVNGSVSHALIHALETGNAAQVQVAANALAANVMDVQGNNLAFGATAAPAVSPIPAHIDSFAQAGTVLTMRRLN